MEILKSFASEATHFKNWYDYIIAYFAGLLVLVSIQTIINYTFYTIPIIMYFTMEFTEKKIQERYTTGKSYTSDRPVTKVL